VLNHKTNDLLKVVVVDVVVVVVVVLVVVVVVVLVVVVEFYTMIQGTSKKMVSVGIKENN
jgi:hypothetical protein